MKEAQLSAIKRDLREACDLLQFASVANISSRLWAKNMNPYSMSAARGAEAKKIEEDSF
jgi:hypothetical protein